MALPRIEIAVGVIDGVNVTFYTPTVPYLSGSVRYYLNGQLQTDDCVIEVNPQSGEVRVDGNGQIPPRVGDVVHLFYIDDGADTGTSLSLGVCRLRGKITTETLYGKIGEADVLSGRLALTDVVRGTVKPVRVLATLREYQPIRGKIKVCTPC